MKTILSIISQRQYSGYNFKIHCKGGCGFWYCGKLTPSTYDTILNREKEKLNKRNQKLIEKNEFRLENLDELYEKIIAYSLKYKNVKDPVAYREREMKKKELERVRIPKYIKRLKEDIAIPFQEREVVETYKGISSDEEPCLIIVIQGTEKGDYWTLAEYEKKHQKKGKSLCL